MAEKQQKQVRAVVIVILCLLFMITVSNILHGSGEGRTGGDGSEGASDKSTVSAEEDILNSEKNGWMSQIVSGLKKQISNAVIPFLAFSVTEPLPDSAAQAVMLQVSREYPLLYYAGWGQNNTLTLESNSTYDMILALEGMDEDRHTVYAEIDSREAMELENQAARVESEWTAAEDSNENVEIADTGNGNAAENDDGSSIVQTTGNDLIQLRSAPAFLYDFSLYQELDSLVKGFYIVDPTTSVTPERLNLNEMLAADMTIHGDSGSPQILIYHTHSQEGYADSIPGDVSTGVVGAGEYLAEILSEQYGYNVIHHTGQYDVEVRDQAYALAKPAIEQLLMENPTIEVVIDLHRDEVNEDVRLATDIDGRNCAKFMFFNGLSYSNTLGEITYLENPHIQENLAFSFQAQVLANEYYPGITRGIYLRAYRYNMHFVGKNMLIELGAQTNTTEEVWNTVPVIAQILDMVFQGQFTSR